MKRFNHQTALPGRPSEHGEPGKMQMLNSKGREPVDRAHVLSKERLEATSTLAARIHLAVSNGFWDRARELVDLGEREEQQATSGEPLLSTPLAALGILTRDLNALEDHLGATTVGELLGLNTDALLAVPNLGNMGIWGVYRNLAAFAVKRCLEMERQIEQTNAVRFRRLAGCRADGPRCAGLIAIAMSLFGQSRKKSKAGTCIRRPRSVVFTTCQSDARNHRPYPQRSARRLTTAGKVSSA